ncbi:hypothetical protein KC19_1G001400 [Ceratodon purpureus]|uniref:Secreted protein n=1 Tax=Ceratodon purpureus TaxID=3225 RepID=A0A8T0J0X7_CERPU|nr:hypothetical protein KC19_1G001400 [Ceratodon purpureus]
MSSSSVMMCCELALLHLAGLASQVFFANCRPRVCIFTSNEIFKSTQSLSIVRQQIIQLGEFPTLDISAYVLYYPSMRSCSLVKFSTFAGGSSLSPFVDK